MLFDRLRFALGENECGFNDVSAASCERGWTADWLGFWTDRHSGRCGSAGYNADEVAITDCTASSELSDGNSCEKAYDNDGSSTFSVASEFGGWIQMNFAQSMNIGSMAFQQRANISAWCTSITLQFSDGSTQVVQLQQHNSLVTYLISPSKQTTSVKITFTEPLYPEGSTPPEGYNAVHGNMGAAEIQFFVEDGVGAYCCSESCHLFGSCSLTRTADMSPTGLTSQVHELTPTPTDCVAGTFRGYRSCAAVRNHDSNSTTGRTQLYSYASYGQDAPGPLTVYCDQSTAGGGWTLVASSTSPLKDFGVPHTQNLKTLTPPSESTGLWNGLRFAAVGTASTAGDMRVSCKTLHGDVDFAVDMVFKDVAWYEEVARSASDGAMCFEAGQPTCSGNHMTYGDCAANFSAASGELETDCTDGTPGVVDEYGRYEHLSNAPLKSVALIAFALVCNDSVLSTAADGAGTVKSADTTFQSKVYLQLA